MISDNFAEGFYELDRAREANSYCDHLEKIMLLAERLHSAISSGKPKKAKALILRLKKSIQAWPVYLYLDVTDERGERIVGQLTWLLGVIERGDDTDFRLACASQILSIFNAEHQEAAQYGGACDD